jgi:hypothetical protein
MTARTRPITSLTDSDGAAAGRAARARVIPASAAVMAVVVRVAGVVPARLDLSHVGTAEQQLGLSIGTVLVYVHSEITARAVAEGWGKAVVLARSLSPAVAGRRPLVVGPSTVAAMVRMAGVPRVTAALAPAHLGPDAPTILRVQVGPVTWEVCDATAYTSLLRAWRQAARLLEDNLTDDEDG